MRILPISNIKLDKTYSFSFPEELESLTQSIKIVGLLQPIILTDSYNIVCGTRRVISCKKLKLKDAPAIILDKNLPDLDLFKINLEDNLSTRTPNIIEKSIILNKLKNNFKIPEEIIIKEYLPMLKIPCNIKYLEKYIRLDKLPVDLKHEIIDKDISIEILDNLKKWPDYLIKLIFSFNFGNGKTFQLITILNEISLHSGKAVDEPLKSIEWLNIYKNPDIPIYQKGRRLREFLLAKRYPIYTEYKNKIRKTTNRIKLPDNISLLLNELLTLENDSINLKVRCKNIEDLKTAAQKLMEISDSQALAELINLLKL